MEFKYNKLPPDQNRHLTQIYFQKGVNVEGLLQRAEKMSSKMAHLRLQNKQMSEKLNAAYKLRQETQVDGLDAPVTT